MPDHPTPPADPRPAAAAARASRCSALELDRLELALDGLDADDRADLLDRAIALREAVDAFDRDLEARAAGLAPTDDYAPMHRNCGQRHQPGTPCPDDPEGGQ